VPSVEKIAEYDELPAADRQWLSDYKLRRLGDADAVTPDEVARAAELSEHDLRIAVFEGPKICAEDESLLDDRAG
jgi:hypothetical protein